MADHILRLDYIPTNNQISIKENFSNEFVLTIVNSPWYAYFANYLISGVIPKDFNYHQRKNFLMMLKVTFGSNHYYIKIVSMVWYVDIFSRMKYVIFYIIVTL